jgi:TPR repeat protein
MLKSGLVAFMAAAAVGHGMAQADEFERGMNTMWEVLWHQAGTPTRLVRWEQDMKVRVHGVNAAAHKKRTLQALRDTATIAGVKVIDVSDLPDAAQQANLDVEILADTALSDAQPCETRIEFQTETRIDSASMRMRNGDARRCAYHEAMHVMGVRGHPEGKTVLSYFAAPADGLMPLDKVMLRAWYSPQARGGMTPFEVLPLLADQLVAIQPDRQRALQSRDRFLSRTVEQMHAFAEGQADVPAIVRKSGKCSDAGVKMGRMEVSYFLGVAYQQGTTVAADEAQAARWLQRAASLGSRIAQARLASAVTTPSASASASVTAGAAAAATPAAANVHDHP